MFRDSTDDKVMCSCTARSGRKWTAGTSVAQRVVVERHHRDIGLSAMGESRPKAEERHDPCRGLTERGREKV